MTNKKPSLDLAYSLKSVQDNLELYSAWAEDYDQDFASKMDYILPDRVAKTFQDVGGEGPILDVGAGTGLAGYALAKLGLTPIDAMDVSRAMLDEASKKGIYRNLFVADITKPIKTSGELYQGIISSGTFTHGHVGPGAIGGLLPLAKAGAYFVLAINKSYWFEKGFAEKFAALSESITDPVLRDVDIYGESSKGEHGKDLGIVVIFQKL